MDFSECPFQNTKIISTCVKVYNSILGTHSFPRTRLVQLLLYVICMPYRSCHEEHIFSYSERQQMNHSSLLSFCSLSARQIGEKMLWLFITALTSKITLVLLNIIRWSSQQTIACGYRSQRPASSWERRSRLMLPVIPGQCTNRQRTSLPRD